MSASPSFCLAGLQERDKDPLGLRHRRVRGQDRRELQRDRLLQGRKVSPSLSFSWKCFFIVRPLPYLSEFMLVMRIT